MFIRHVVNCDVKQIVDFPPVESVPLCVFEWLVWIQMLIHIALWFKKVKWQGITWIITFCITLSYKL